MLNALVKKQKLIITLFLFYLAVCPTVMVTSGIMRLFPTLALSFFLFCGIISWSRIKYARMGILIKCFAIFIIFNALITESAYGNSMITIIKSTFWVSIYGLSYVFFEGSCIEKKNYQKWVFIISTIIMLVFYVSHNIRLTEIGDGAGDNVIFYSLMLIPWMSHIQDKRCKWIIIACLFFCTLLSLKRSSTIIFGSAVAITYFSDFIFKKKIEVSTLLMGVIIVVSMIGVLNFASDKVAIVAQRFESIEDDGGSGRDEIYEDVFSRYSTGSIKQKIFGRGFDGVRRDSSYLIPVSAHNDFLEVLYDFGVIGFFFYLLIHLSLIKWMICLFRARSQLAFPVLISYVCFLVMSLVSHLILYPTYFGLLTAFWAYAECEDNKLKK